MNRALKIACWLLLAGVLLCGSGIVQQAYNLIEFNGTPVARGTTLNFTNGTNTTVSCSTTGAVTTCTYSASGGGGGGVNKASASFTNQTSVVITDSLGTTTKQVQCDDAASPPNVIYPQNIAITDANDVTVTFSSSQSGTCIVIG
jgi:hypothetical protein